MTGTRGCHALELQLDATTPFLEHKLQLLAFSRSRCRQIGERLLEQGEGLVGQRLRAEGCLGQHARPTKDLDDRKRRAARRVMQHLVGGVTKLYDPGGIDGELRHTGRGPIQRNPAIDFAALELLGKRIPNRRFDGTQLVRQADLEIEIAVVDRTQFHGQRTAGQLGGDRREAGHAQYHRVVVSGVGIVLPGAHVEHVLYTSAQ